MSATLASRPDSAAAFLHLILDPPGAEPPNVVAAPLWEPFVRRRLAETAIRSGRMEEARRQWRILSESCVRPDDEARRLLDETRMALQAAEGVGAPERR